ncbi:MAG: glycosyltransferase, partial [Flavobacteriaceae bacterium]|nr:glycosyltransferase [Flavobacteriaceae bacterium]
KVIANIIKNNNIGFVTKTHNPKELANEINSILEDEITINEWKSNLKMAAMKYTWENESKNLQKIFSNLK